MKTKSILLFTVAILAITANVKAQNIPNYIPTHGLVGWWPFNGNANDESGNGNDGTVNGSNFSQDRFGAVNSSINQQLDGNYIRTQSVISNVANTFSIAFWVNPTEIDIIKSQGVSGYEGAATMSVIHPPHGSNWGSTANNAGVGINVGINQIQVLEHSHLYVASPLVFLAEILGWHQIVLVYDNHIPMLYLDGNMVATGLVSSIQNVRPGNGYCAVYTQSGFGCSFSPNGNPMGRFKGDYDDIAIWNRALTQQEVTALYTASSSNNNETSNTTANVPSAISYQAVARDAQGAPLANTNLQVRFTLIADSLSGAAEYVETHTLSTNSLGLFTTAFGAGTPASNNFGNINWSAGNKFLMLQIDTGNGWIDMGTQQLLSTPYSMHSATSGAIKNPGLPVFADNAAALAGGLVAGDMYRTASGDLKIVY